MQRQRLSLGAVIGVTAGISMIYLMSVLAQSRADVVFGLFALSIAATAWMTIRVLKDPHSTKKTFEDQFYQDRDDIRCRRTK